MIKDELEIPSIIIIHTLQDKEYYPIFINEEIGNLEVKSIVQVHTAGNCNWDTNLALPFILFLPFGCINRGHTQG